MMEDEKSRGVFHSAAKRKSAQSIQDAAMKVLSALNKFGHRVRNDVLMMKWCLLRDRLGLKGINCTHTPAGLHNNDSNAEVEDENDKSGLSGKASVSFGDGDQRDDAKQQDGPDRDAVSTHLGQDAAHEEVQVWTDGSLRV